MPQREVIRTLGGDLQFEFAWPDASRAAEVFGLAYGHLTVTLNDQPVWPPTAPQRAGVAANWIELLEHLGTYWRYLVLEQGYPFHVRPEKPSQLEGELSSRWENVPESAQSAEEEEAYAFELSHNLAEASPGSLRPDLWFVRDGGLFTVEAQTGPRTLVTYVASSEVRTLLTRVGDAIAARLESAADHRSEQAKRAWSNRESAGLDVLAPIATGLSGSYLQETCGAAPMEEIFDDGESSWAGENVFLDVAYRCKGLMPPQVLRGILRQTRAVPHEISKELQFCGEVACRELASRESALPRPYQQGRALANWLRENLAAPNGRVEPEQLLSNWGVPVSMQDLATRWLDAVAVWGHGRQPMVVCNSSEKHRDNEGARRATLAHEICHLLIDRCGSLPLSAVVGGAMEQSTEKRANAFAAEFLCPRREAGEEFRRDRNVIEAVRQLTVRFGVSKELASMQLANSGELNDPNDQTELESLGPPRATYPWRR